MFLALVGTRIAPPGPRQATRVARNPNHRPVAGVRDAPRIHPPGCVPAHDPDGRPARICAGGHADRAGPHLRPRRRVRRELRDGAALRERGLPRHAGLLRRRSGRRRRHLPARRQDDGRHPELGGPGVDYPAGALGVHLCHAERHRRRIPDAADHHLRPVQRPGGSQSADRHRHHRHRPRQQPGPGGGHRQRPVDPALPVRRVLQRRPRNPQRPRHGIRGLGAHQREPLPEFRRRHLFPRPDHHARQPLLAAQGL